MISNPDTFIENFAKAAQDSAKNTGIPASFAIAEAALESGWGRSLLAQRANNYFGVKADKAWKGEIYSMPTREYFSGKWVMVNANWRKYPTPLECLKDHALFLLTNPRYRGCFKFTTGKDFAKAVQAAGYATDPNYATLINTLIDQHKLEDFDKA